MNGGEGSRLDGGPKVAFVAVGVADDRTLLAWSTAQGAQVELDGVRAAISRRQMRDIETGKHYNFSTNGQTWHVVGDDRGLLFLAVTAISYPLRHASGLLTELASQIQGRIADKALAIQMEGGLNVDAKPLLGKLISKYSDLSRVDQLHATMTKVEAVKVVMQDSIELALQNCVALESIDQKADELQNQAGMFKTRAKNLRRQMWWKKCKMQLLVAFLVIVILCVIIVPIVVMQQQSKDSGKR